MAVSFLLPLFLHAAAWHEPKANVRFRIEPNQAKDTGSGQTPTTSHVTVWPAGTDPTRVTPVVFAASGKRVGAHVLWARKSEPVELLFDSSASAPSYLVYLVDGPASAGPAWEPDTGLVLASKAFSRAVDSLSVDAFVKAWNRTPQSLGRSVVANIHHAFPVHRPSFDNPLEYNAVPGPPFWLNRYAGFFRAPPIAEGAMANAKKELKQARKILTEVQALLTEAEAALQKVQAELDKAREDPASASVSAKVLSKRVGAARWKADDLKRNKLVVAKRNVEFWDAAIHELQDGTYTFYAGGETGLHVLVDGQPVISGSAGKKIRGRRNLYQLPDRGSIRLTPGIHRLECLHYAKRKNTLAMVAWRHPGARPPTVMSPMAFLPCGRFAVSAADRRGDATPVFSWRITEDLRCPGAGDMVSVRFGVRNPQQGMTYTWHFGDGRSATGATVDHLYLLTGTYNVRLAESAGPDKPAHVATESVYAHVLWAKHHLADLKTYEPIIAAADLSGVRIDHVANAYTFAHRASPDRTSLLKWREHCRRAIVARVEEFGESQASLLLRAAAESADYRLKRYGDARACYEAALRPLPETSSIRHSAHLSLAELLIRVMGDADEAEKHVAALEKHAAFEGDQELRLALAKADIMLARERVGEALNLLRGKIPQINPREMTPSGVRQRAQLRHARRLVEQNARDMVQLEHALAKVAALVRADPMNHVSPEVNLVALDTYLARGETGRALLLTDRLLKLNLNDVSRPSVLAKRVRALLALDQTEEAREVLNSLRTDYPYSRGRTEAEGALDR